MPDTLKPCRFDNYMCMCQFCEDKCNNGLHCSDCEHNGKVEHTVYLCTGFVGDTVAYLNNMKDRRVGHEPAGECAKHNRAERGSWCGEEGEKG